MSRLPWLRVLAACAVEAFNEMDRRDLMFGVLAGAIRDAHWNNVLTQGDCEVQP